MLRRVKTIADPTHISQYIEDGHGCTMIYHTPFAIITLPTGSYYEITVLHVPSTCVKDTPSILGISLFCQAQLEYASSIEVQLEQRFAL